MIRCSLLHFFTALNLMFPLHAFELPTILCLKPLHNVLQKIGKLIIMKLNIKQIFTTSSDGHR